MSYSKNAVCAMVTTCLVVAAPHSFAQSAAVIKQGETVCAEAVIALNVLADFTETFCTPAKGADGKISLIFISKHRVFDNPQRKRAYLIFLTGAAGSSLNKRPKLPVDWVTTMDPDLGEKGKYWRLSAEDTRRLQKQVRDGAIKLEKFVAELEAKGSLQAADKRK